MSDEPAPAPNILLITVDQMRYPCLGYGADAGFASDLKDVLGFRPLAADNRYAAFFPGLGALRKNAVVFNHHTIATSACVPSRGVIYTGQYGTKTGVRETDSLFKLGENHAFPWLAPDGIPTMGDWFRAAGYTTHYFGKWDLSYADGAARDGWGHAPGSLEPWGFSDWEQSAPDAQGGEPNELGVYRDPGYADLVTTFLRRKAMNYAPPRDGSDPKPWLAVASLVNPHDIASAYPRVWFAPDGIGVQTDDRIELPPMPIPAPGARSNPMAGGTMAVPLNPDGFPQDCFANPATIGEDLSTKPDCQYDYAYKMGLALKSRRREKLRGAYPMPFQLQGDQADAWFSNYGQFYGYLHYLVDRQIDRIMRCLHESGLAATTHVVFLADHGEYGGAHRGMIEKWHSAYEEILHVPLVISSPAVNPSADTPVYLDGLTSHVDVLPTLLGLAGVSQQQAAYELATTTTHEVIPLAGADLMPVVTAKVAGGEEPAVTEPTGEARAGVLFITEDTITDVLEPVPPDVAESYAYFLQDVDAVAASGAAALKPGSVCQPNHIRCIKVPGWKLARYLDPGGGVPDQWEMYYLTGDPTEASNLVSWDEDGEPVVRDDPAVLGPLGLTAAEVEAQLSALREQLFAHCERLL